MDSFSTQRDAEVCFEAVRARGNLGVALLVGAGCSCTANIPTADGFVAKIREQYPERCKGLAKNDYESATNMLSDGEWRRLFGQVVADAKLNVAHLCIAELVAAGVVARILTTNFDSLLMQACALGGRFPLIHDCAAADPLDEWIDEEGEAIFYLHGQEHGRKMLNPGMLKRQTESADGADDGPGSLDRLLKVRAGIVSRVVMGTIRRRPLIVCGYSGKSDRVFEELQQAEDLMNPVFWLPFNGDDAARALSQFQRDRLRDRVYVMSNYGADEFFWELVAALGIKIPQTLQTPGRTTRLAARRISLPPNWGEWKLARYRPGHRAASTAIPGENQIPAEAVLDKETPKWEESSS